MGIQLINHTALPASLCHGFLDQHTKLAFVYARSTWAWDPVTGHVEPASQVWPVFDHPLQTTAGTFAADRAARKHGCEVVVIGSARCDRPTRQLDVTVSLGRFSRTLRLFGDRHWAKGANGLRASEPERFTEMPIRWDRAFGGRTRSEGVELAHPLNPHGRGFYLSADEAADHALPNIEDPAALINSWNDLPMPVGFGPVASSLPWFAYDWMAARNNDKAPTANEAAETAGTWSIGAATPTMIAPPLEPGDRLVGQLGDTHFDTEVPHHTPSLTAHMGRDIRTQPMRPVGIWALLDERLLVVTSFASFRYNFRPREERRVFLGNGNR